IGFIFLPQNTKWKKLFYLFITAILLMGFYLSFSRAAWLSFVAAIGVWAILKLRIKFSWLLVGGMLLGATFFYYADDILYKMGRNQQ
ncbi:MAG: hypothetical protein RR034_03240, partial [Bacteroidales bacterium]